MSNTKEEIEAKDIINKKRSFDKWLNNPMTKALLATLPSTENSDLFKALLQACFENGYDCGAGANASMFLQAMFKRPDKE